MDDVVRIQCDCTTMRLEERSILKGSHHLLRGHVMKLFFTSAAKRISAVIFGFLCSIFLTTSFIHAASQDEVMKEMQEAASAIGEYSVDQKDKAIVEAKELMDKLDKNMEETESSMKEKWNSLEDSAKQNYELSKKEMEKQRQELADWIDKMQDSSADAWEETKKGFAGAHDSLSSSWQRVKEEMATE